MVRLYWRFGTATVARPREPARAGSADSPGRAARTFCAEPGSGIVQRRNSARDSGLTRQSRRVVTYRGVWDPADPLAGPDSETCLSDQQWGIADTLWFAMTG
jgi:hypothetical protein